MDKDEAVDLHLARERAKSISFIRGSGGLAVKIARGQKMPNSESHPRNNTIEKHEKTLLDIEFGDSNLGVHTYGTLVDVDIDYKEDNLYQYLMPALDVFLPPSGHVWGTEKRPRTHRAYLVKGDEEYDPRSFPILNRLQKIPQATVEVRGGALSTGRFSLLPPSLHPTDGLYHWDTRSDPSISLSVTTPHALIRAIRLAGGVALLAPYWVEGQRQEMTMALSGFLHRIAALSVALGVDETTEEDVFRIDQDTAVLFLETLLDVIEDDPKDKIMRKKAFQATWKKADAGVEVTGATRMRELSGNENLVKQLYTLFTDNPELERYQAFEDKFGIIQGTGDIADMEALDNKLASVALMTRGQFVNSHAHQSILLGKKPRAMTDMVYRSNTVTRFTGFTFDPSTQNRKVYKDKNTYLNYWTGYEVPPADTVEDHEVEKFTWYIHNILANGDKDRTAWITAWCADIFQNPTDKTGTSLILVGRQGSGKSFLGEGILGAIIGEQHYVNPTQVGRISDKFNDLFGHNLLIQLDEAMNSNQRQQADYMKGLITNKMIEIEPKGHAIIKLPAHHRILITSNHTTNSVALDGGNEDRRYSIYEVCNKWRKDADFWEGMIEWFSKKENLAKVHRYLLNYKYDRKLIRYAPTTDEKVRTASSSMESLDRWLLNMLERNHPLDPHTHKYWYQASNLTKINKSSGVIDRTSWPMYVQAEALAEDFERLERSLPHNLKQYLTPSTLMSKLGLMGIVDISKKPRLSISTYDDRTGAETIHRMRFALSPNPVEIRRYLVDRHGALILEDVDNNIEDMQLTGEEEEHGPKF